MSGLDKVDLYRAGWNASPSAGNSVHMLAHYSMDWNYVGSSNTLRPIVCLKNIVSLEKQEDGTYRIVK